MRKLADLDLNTIHAKVHLLLITSKTDLLFSSRQAIANEVWSMLKTAGEHGEHVLREHLKFQESHRLPAPSVADEEPEIKN